MSGVEQNRRECGVWSEVEGPGRRGRPPLRWRDKVKEYMTERGDCGVRVEEARKECLDRERWRLFCCDHLLIRRSRRE